MIKQPVKENNRIDLLDVCRGFAILGIFVVNIVVMHSTFLNQDEFAKQWTSLIDVTTKRILQLFFYTKFFPIFSFLFGLGIAMQAIKLRDKNHLRYAFFARRMAVLFVFGLLHILLLWSGDVLHLYAMLGLLITVMIKLPDKVIISLSLIILFFPFYDPLFEFLFKLLHFQPDKYLAEHTGESINLIITGGTYTEGLKLRLLEYLSNIPMLYGFLMPIALSMFLIGIYFGKNKIYNHLDSFISRIKIPAIIIAIAANFYSILFLFVLTKSAIYKIEIIRTVLIKLMVVTDVAMGLFYLWLLGWMWYHNHWQKILSPLKYVGRMALTNYILQSIAGLVLFSSLGFRLYETLRPYETLLLSACVFISQVVLSKIWLTYFKFGPLEWIWRSLTYKKIFSLKKSVHM